MEITFTLKRPEDAFLLRSGILSGAALSDRYSIVEDGWIVNGKTTFSRTILSEVTLRGGNFDCSLAVKLEVQKGPKAFAGKLIVQWDEHRVCAKRVRRFIYFLTRKGLESPATQCIDTWRLGIDGIVDWVRTLQ